MNIKERTKKACEYLKTTSNIKNNSEVSPRFLEIGPGKKRIPGFETLNIINPKEVDYVCDASKKLPFKDETFDIIYASHILEHIPWYQTENVLKEWVRVLKPRSVLEIWVPDGVKICKTFVEAEENIANNIHLDGWYRFNEEQDPCKWASGRIFTYGDGTGRRNHPNWHFALFSFRYLAQLLLDSGLSNIRQLDRNEIRGYDHGWINLGISGEKK